MTDKPLTAQEEASILVEQADELAKAMIEDMEGDECVEMVRGFCKVMAEWQPNIAENAGEPVMLGLHCLAASQLFRLAFAKAYCTTDQRLKAQEAIDKALGGLE